MSQAPQFAAQYPRTPEGWIDFPVDSSIRREWFPESLDHPAKANLYMMCEILEEVAGSNERIMDIMSGTGSLLLACALLNRTNQIVLVEIEQPYHDMQIRLLEVLRLRGHDDLVDRAMLLHGDCRKLMPIPVNHIIFSPHYSDILKQQESSTFDKEHSLAGRATELIRNYSNSRGNVGSANKFLYNQWMETVYKLCYLSLKPGGTLTVILMDATVDNKRVRLVDWMIRCCTKVGFSVLAHHRRYGPGTGYKKLWKSKGVNVVEDESIVIMRRPW